MEKGGDLVDRVTDAEQGIPVCLERYGSRQHDQIDVDDFMSFTIE